MKESNELRYFSALKRIAAYQTPEQLQRNAVKQYGLNADDAISMAYENVLEEAKSAVRGKRAPKSE